MKLNKTNPTDLSKRDWKHALKETRSALQDKDIPMFAAGVAYYSTLAFFPTIVALVTLYGFFVSPARIVELGRSAGQVLPGAMADLVTRQLVPLAQNGKAGLISGLIALAIAVFSASTSVQNLIKALNHAYEVEERRKGIKLRLISIGFMLGLLLAAIPILALIIINPGFVLLRILRWILLAMLVSLILAVIYRYAPDRREPRWNIVSWGGVAATLIWLLGTLLFFIYVQYLSSFDKSYGIFAGLIILMTWLNLSAFIILLGAEVNHRLENRLEPTRRLRTLFRRST